MLVFLPDHDTLPVALQPLSHHEFVFGPEIAQSRPYQRPADIAPYAYLLFTSGSTGTPKGVGVTHRNACRYLRSALERYRPGHDDRFSQFFDSTFDLSVHDLFLCWGAGACLHAATRSALLVPVPFAREHELSFWFSVPSLAIQAIRMGLRSEEMPKLRWSLFCGEALPSAIAEAWQRATPQACLENLYGPTEATIAITAYHYQPAQPPAEAVVPIGAPFPEQEVLLLDANLQPVSPGAVGELCLGGSQVTPGYWENPVATERQFLSRRYLGRRNERWYRTGDLASWREGVGLIFHGRIDSQLKISGYRVEASEVEAVVRSRCGVDMVAAIPWPLTPDGNALGLIVYGCGFRLSGAKMRERCAQVLPSYMVPSEFREIEALPVNANGKTDYKKLREIAEQQPKADRQRPGAARRVEAAD